MRDYGGENRLDRIRRIQGADACKSYFHELAASNRKNAVFLLNDRRMSFGTLFLLSDELKGRATAEGLSPRNRAALKLCSGILAGKSSAKGEKISYRDPMTRAALLWMFQTGCKDDGANNDFDEVLDISASILLRYYREKSILPAAADLLFQRGKKGTYRHDLAWAMIHSHNPDVLQILSEHLLSGDEAEAGLARALLSLPDPGPSKAACQEQYRSYRNWLRENRPYLYFTGEGFHRSSRPMPCGVDLEAKYLGKTISPHSRAPLAPWTEAETTCRRFFCKASENNKKLLSSFSLRLRRQNPARWHRWIRLPLEEQIRIAAGNRGGAL